MPAGQPAHDTPPHPCALLFLPAYLYTKFLLLLLFHIIFFAHFCLTSALVLGSSFMLWHGWYISLWQAVLSTGGLDFAFTFLW